MANDLDASAAVLFEDAICLAAARQKPNVAMAGISMAMVRVFLAAGCADNRGHFLNSLGEIYDVCVQSLKDEGRAGKDVCGYEY